MIRRLFGIVAVMGLCGSMGCSQGRKPLQVKGSDTMVNLVQAWAAAYMESKSEELVAVTGGGSGTGISSLIGGTCDIAMASRSIKPEEIALAEKKGIHPIRAAREILLEFEII